MSFATALADAVPFQPFTEAVSSKFAAIRKDYGGTLAIDLFLDAGDESEIAKFPPRNRTELKEFIQKVDASPSLTRPAKARIIYYLLLEYPPEKTNNESVALYYANEMYLGEAQRHFVRGLWYLDHGDLESGFMELGEPWERGVLEDPAVLKVYPWIVSVLSQQPELLVEYLESKRDLRSYQDNRAFVDALLATGRIARVFELSRELSDDALLSYLATKLASTTDRTLAWNAVSLAWTSDEWELIQAELDVAIDENPGSLAGELSLVRALHMGDLQQINQLKKVVPGYELITKNAAVM